MNAEFREATIEDYAQLLDLTDEFYYRVSGMKDILDLDHASMVTTFDALRHEGILLVAESDGILIGVLAAAVVPTYFNRNLISAHELFWYVIPEAQRSGVGKGLFDAFRQACKHKGVHVMSVTNANNKYAEKVEKMYLKESFLPVGRTYMRRV